MIYWCGEHNIRGTTELEVAEHAKAHLTNKRLINIA